MSDTSSPSYTRTAKFLHWVIAFAILFMLALGWSFDFLPKGDTKFFLFQLHKSLGLTILVLSFVRLGWRLSHRAPPLPPSMPVWERKVSAIIHGFLYLGMIALPLTGWAMSSATPRNIPFVYFGLFHVPPIGFLTEIDNRQQVADFFDSTHGVLAIILAVLLILHLGAALKHHFVGRDDSLLSMAPRCCGRWLNRLRGRRV